MKSCIQSILPSSKTKNWPTLPTIKEEPGFFNVPKQHEQRRPRKSVFYEGVVNDLKKSGNVEPEVLEVVTSVYAKKIAQDYVRSECLKQQVPPN
jgi:hypothetical protein